MAHHSLVTEGGSDHKAIPNLKKGEEEQSCHVLGKRGPAYLGKVLPILKTSSRDITSIYFITGLITA